MQSLRKGRHLLTQKAGGLFAHQILMRWAQFSVTEIGFNFRVLAQSHSHSRIQVVGYDGQGKYDSVRLTLFAGVL
jgi:hypothetical protein